MLRTIVFFALLGIAFAGSAQETVEISEKYSPGVIEKYHVLKSNNNIKQGLYQAFYKRNIVIASGGYDHGVRMGMWHFYDIKGKAVQLYNYNKKQIISIVDEDTSHNIIRYDIVGKLTNTDSIRLPARIGGIFYGYLPYIKKFKVADAALYNPGSMYGVLELLISPNGRLAECKLLVKVTTMVNWQPTESVVDRYLLNTELLTEEEKQFIPAAVNHQNVSSTIYIYCNVNLSGRLSIY